jgi:hypothetical protein
MKITGEKSLNYAIRDTAAYERQSQVSVSEGRSPTVVSDLLPLKAGRARGRDAVPLGGGGVLLGGRRSSPFALSLLLLAVTLRLRLREDPARVPRAPPLPLPFPPPLELPPRPLPRLATGGSCGGGASASSPEEDDGSSCAPQLPAPISFLRCSRKSLTTCCNRLLA